MAGIDYHVLEKFENITNITRTIERSRLKMLVFSDNFQSKSFHTRKMDYVLDKVILGEIIIGDFLKLSILMKNYVYFNRVIIHEILIYMNEIEMITKFEMSLTRYQLLSTL